MPDNSILILSGPDGISSEANERLRRHATHDDLSIVIEQPMAISEWGRVVRQHQDSCIGIVLCPDLNQSPGDGYLDILYPVLADFCAHGGFLAEVHEGNIFKTDTEVSPLQPPGCHVRLVCGLGAAGYLLAVDSLLHAGGVQ